MSLHKAAESILTAQINLYTFTVFNSIGRRNERDAMTLLFDNLNNGLLQPIWFKRDDSRHGILELSDMRVLTYVTTDDGKLIASVNPLINEVLLENVYELVTRGLKTVMLHLRCDELRRDVGLIEKTMGARSEALGNIAKVLGVNKL